MGWRPPPSRYLALQGLGHTCTGAEALKDMQGSYAGRWGLPEHRRPRPNLENRPEMSDHSGSSQGAVREQSGQSPCWCHRYHSVATTCHVPSPPAPLLKVQRSTGC